MYNQYMNTAQDRLAALRAKAKASGFVAPAPKNPATIGQKVIARPLITNRGQGSHFTLQDYYACVHGVVVKIDGMDIWVEGTEKSYKVSSLGCQYIK
jgi:hypothetical protein